MGSTLLYSLSRRESWHISCDSDWWNGWGFHRGGEALKYSHDNRRYWRVGIYTVDKASEYLGIPRPTLYRYLREYSIPHVKKSGRISIPEESVEEIRRARDLHREGMGTTSVRRMLRESTDSVPVRKDDELSARLDRLAGELEGLREDPRSLEEASSPHALRIILARQSLLISAVYNLTGMVEELMRTGGNHRRPSPGSYDAPEAHEALGRIALVTADIENGYTEGAFVEGRPDTHLSRPSGSPVIRVSTTSRSAEVQGEIRDGGEFGTLAKKRRRDITIVAVVAVCIAVAVLALAIAGVL